jgi:DNA-binding transcriptional regulator GbsR (MarR family)
MDLSPATRRFVLHWGEKGTRWGVNRTVAQVHALLYLSPEPLHAEEIARTLAVARSNVSQSLRELQRWGLVKVIHVLGDRRDHFETVRDVWEMFRIVLHERKRREIDPTLETLRRTVAEVGGRGDAETLRRLGVLLEFFETADAAYARLARASPRTLKRLLAQGSKLQRLLGLGR